MKIKKEDIEVVYATIRPITVNNIYQAWADSERYGPQLIIKRYKPEDRQKKMIGGEIDSKIKPGDFVVIRRMTKGLAISR